MTSPADDTAPAAAARSERGDSETSQSQGSDVLPDHSEFDAAEFDHDDADADAGDAGFQCSSCSEVSDVIEHCSSVQGWKVAERATPPWPEKNA